MTTIRVVDTDDDHHDFMTATHWYVDENNNVHIMNGDTELHCHRRGLWAYVERHWVAEGVVDGTD